MESLLGIVPNICLENLHHGCDHAEFSLLYFVNGKPKSSSSMGTSPKDPNYVQKPNQMASRLHTCSTTLDSGLLYPHLQIKNYILFESILRYPELRAQSCNRLESEPRQLNMLEINL